MSKSRFRTYARAPLRLWRALRTRLFPGRVVVPSFLIIGAAKAGTTSLYRYLSQHPGVLPARKKEIGYFSHGYDKGWDWYMSFFPFDPGRADAITGEATPSYLLYPHAARLAHQHLPEARIIVLLRNPVDRAYSQFQQTHNLGRDPLPTFEECIDREPERVNPDLDRARADPLFHSYNLDQFSYLTRGHYFEQLQPWSELFPPERRLILSAEDFFARPADVMAQVHDFLGLARHALPAYEPEDLKSQGRNYGPMKPETRQRLVEYFRPHNQRLYEHLGRSFDWDR